MGRWLLLFPLPSTQLHWGNTITSLINMDVHVWINLSVSICRLLIHLYLHIFCHSAGWLLGSNGGAHLTLWSVCGLQQRPPQTHTHNPLMWDIIIYIFFSLPSFIFQNLHTNRHKHLNTNPHVDAHECTSHFGMWRNFVFVASPLVLRNGVHRTHCGGAWAFPWRSPFAGVHKDTSPPPPFCFQYTKHYYF